MRPLAASAPVVILLLAGASVSAQTVSRDVVACGGSAAAGAAYTVVGTIAQPLVGRTAGAGEPDPILCSGWWCGEFGTVVAVAPAETPAPRVTSLSPPVPNPGRGAVRLPFDLARSARVEMTIYSVTGARVRTLALGERLAGRHEARWDGRGARGEPHGSGVYVAVLRADGRAAGRQRIVLIR